MLSRKQRRDVHIALAVGVVILFGGGFLVRNSGEAAMQLVGLAAFVGAFGTLTFLAEKEIRHQERDEL
ncbi:MAG TPA: hypothetical protein VFT10_08920, partial [Solirubrobacterales bacterium]|nr:hypothetical protein [Solirubrobacterales bacterium]